MAGVAIIPAALAAGSLLMLELTLFVATSLHVLLAVGVVTPVVLLLLVVMLVVELAFLEAAALSLREL